MVAQTEDDAVVAAKHALGSQKISLRRKQFGPVHSETAFGLAWFGLNRLGGVRRPPPTKHYGARLLLGRHRAKAYLKLLATSLNMPES